MMEPMWLQCRCAGGSSRRDRGVHETTSEIQPQYSSAAEEDTVLRDAVVEVTLNGPRTVAPRTSLTVPGMR
jgi:hypothetical protein